MSSFRPPFRRRVVVSAINISNVIRKPKYATAGLLSALITLGILAWIPNLGLLWSVLNSHSISPWSKLSFALSGYTSLLTNYSSTGALILALFAILTGLNLALVVYVTGSSYKQATLNGTRNIVALALAAIGAGCTACGTSFLAPLLGGAAGAATIAFTGILGIAINIAGAALLTYSVYRLGLSAPAK